MDNERLKQAIDDIKPHKEALTQLSNRDNAITINAMTNMNKYYDFIQSADQPIQEH